MRMRMRMQHMRMQDLRMRMRMQHMRMQDMRMHMPLHAPRRPGHLREVLLNGVEALLGLPLQRHAAQDKVAQLNLNHALRGGGVVGVWNFEGLEVVGEGRP
jgi:hypothetical protein